jgi:hypothetical protein
MWNLVHNIDIPSDAKIIICITLVQQKKVDCLNHHLKGT